MPDWEKPYQPGRRGATISERSRRGSWKAILALTLGLLGLIALAGVLLEIFS